MLGTKTKAKTALIRTECTRKTQRYKKNIKNFSVPVITKTISFQFHLSTAKILHRFSPPGVERSFFFHTVLEFHVTQKPSGQILIADQF